MRGVRHAAARLQRRHKENELWPWNSRKTKRIRRATHKDLCRDCATRFFLVIDDGTRTMRPYRVVIIMTGQMRMKRLTVTMLGLIGIEMHVQKRRAERACLHQHDEGGRGQPAKHRGIVVKDEWARHLTIS